MKFLLFCAVRPISVLMAAAGIVLFGCVAFVRLGRELLPSLRIPVLRVVTEYPGIPAEETEKLVTVPLENVLSSVKGLRGMESVTKEGITATVLRCDWTTDLRSLSVEVREKIDAAFPYLPHGIKRPHVYTEDLNAEPILVLAAVPKQGRTIRDISPLVRKELAARIARIPGVASVETAGTEEPEILVNADRFRLSSAGLGVGNIAEAIAASVIDMPVGTIPEGGKEYLVKASTDVATLESLREIPLFTDASPGTLRVGETAEVHLRTREKTSFFLIDGEEAVGIFVEKMPGAGSLNTARAVIAGMPRLAEIFERDFTLTIIRDATEEIARSFSGLLLALAAGTAAVIVVLVSVFGRMGPAFITAASIPFSSASVFLFMHFAGFSLNIVSLSGIALGIGMIVDASIVTLENLLRKKAESPGSIVRAAAETAGPAFASTLTSMLVFLPVIFIPGVAGALFTEMALVVSFLLAASLVFSLTVTPALYSLFTPRFAGGPRREGGFRRMYRGYLFAAFRRPWIPLGIFLVLLAGGGALFCILPASVMPRRDPGRLEGRLHLPPGTGIREGLHVCRDLAPRILSVPGATRIFIETGFETGSLRERSATGKNSWTCGFTVILEGTTARAAEERIGGILAKMEGVRFSLSEPKDTTGRLLGAEEELCFLLSGSEREALVSRAGNLVRGLEKTGHLSRVTVDTEKNLPRLSFRIDDSAAAFHGISAREILENLRLSVRGEVPAVLHGPGEPVEIRVRLGIGDSGLPEALAEIPLAVRDGFIEAGSLGRFERDRTYPELHRRDRKAAVTLRFLPSPGRGEELEAFLASSSEGVLLSRSGLTESAREAVLVFALSAVLMFLVLGAQFESVRIPPVLMLSFPLSIPGSFLLLFLFGYGLNLNSLLGILILMGTTINSAIILTAAYGKGGTFRIIRKSVRRLAPLCATAGTSLTALLPVLFNRSGESVMQSNTAAAIAGGLAAGTAAILLVYPVLYRYAAGRRKA